MSGYFFPLNIFRDQFFTLGSRHELIGVSFWDLNSEETINDEYYPHFELPFFTIGVHNEKCF